MLDKHNIIASVAAIILILISILMFIHAQGYLETQPVAGGLEIGIGIFIFIYAVTRLEKVLKG